MKRGYENRIESLQCALDQTGSRGVTHEILATT
jgi:hypothetical protein